MKPTILIIIGISGDLATRKLLPAIAQIVKTDILPEHFRVVGTSRRELNAADFTLKNLDLITLDVTKQEEYLRLAEHLRDIESAFGSPAQRLFYLSVPPEATPQIIQALGESGLNNIPDTKILLEKPFGQDLVSAEQLVAEIEKYFREEQIYRIDHYLAKEMAQNLLIFRAKNSLFKHTWNNTYIESIEIIASETIGIEGRTKFYEQTGALRDFVQSHLLQLTALVLMELPKDFGHGDSANYWHTVPEKRLRALEQLTVSSRVTDQVRAQYSGYREDVGNPLSQTETLVSLVLYSADPVWAGVPICLTTGKALAKKTTEIRVHYIRDTTEEANTLIVRIQPKEGIEMCIWVKEPGYTYELKKYSLDFSYTEHFAALPEAYERVFVDALRSDHSLFTTSQEVLASWRILAPVQEMWARDTTDIDIYEKGKKAESQ